MKKKMTKDQIVDALDGKTIMTADGATHLVKAGKFKTRLGATVELKTMCISHLRAFLASVDRCAA